MAVLRDFSRRTSTSSSPTIIVNKVQLFTASQGAWLQPSLELSDPLAQLPCVHVLTDAVSYLPRSLDYRRLRRRRPRLTLRRREEVVVHGTPTGESNPAATSNSWWQGPPLGHSQTPRRSRHPAHMSHSHGSSVVWAKVQAPIVRRSTNRLRAYSRRSSMTHRRQTVHLRHCGAQWPNGSSLMAQKIPEEKAPTPGPFPSWPSYRL